MLCIPVICVHMLIIHIYVPYLYDVIDMSCHASPLNSVHIGIVYMYVFGTSNVC